MTLALAGGQVIGGLQLAGGGISNQQYPAADANDIVHLYVAATGNDVQIGSATAPILTMAEAMLRLERWVTWGRDQELVIHDATGQSYAEDVRLKLQCPPKRRITIMGHESGQTVLASGTATAGSAVTLTNAGAVWGAANQYAGRIVRIKRAGVVIAHPEIREHTATVLTFCESNPEYTFASGDTYEILRPVTRLNSFGAVLPWSTARVQSLAFQAPTGMGPLLCLAHMEIGPGVVNEDNQNCALLLQGGETAIVGCCVVGSTNPAAFTPYGVRLVAGARLSAGLLFTADQDYLFGVAPGSYLYNGCGLRCDTGTFGLHNDDGNFTGCIVCLDTGIRIGAFEGLNGTGSPSGSIGAVLDMRAGAIINAGMEVRSGCAFIGSDTAVRFQGTSGIIAAVRVYEGGRATALKMIVGDLSRDIFWLDGGRLHVRTGAIEIVGNVLNYVVTAYFGALARIAAGAVTITPPGVLGGAYNCEATAIHALDAALTTGAPLFAANGGSRIFRGEYEP